MKHPCDKPLRVLVAFLEVLAAALLENGSMLNSITGGKSCKKNILTRFCFFLLFTLNLTACDIMKSTISNKPITDFFDDEKVQQLALAAAEGDVDVIEDLIKNQGVDPNTLGKEANTPKGKEIMTPLRYAWWTFTDDSVNGMKALLKHGAQADQTINGITLLDRSVLNPGERYHEISKVLLEGGANPNRVKSDSKKTPIFSALYGKQFERVKLLHQFGADVDFKEKCDKTPFMMALAIRSFDIAFWLVEQGVDVEAMTKYGGTAAWEIHDSLTNKLYSDWAREAGLKMKAILEKKGVVFPPLSPEENRKKFNLTGDC